MKSLLAAIATMAFFSTTSYAETYAVNAKVTNVQANMVSIERPVPTQKCQIVRVPITETRYSSRNGASSGDLLGGMIIGGLMGKGASGDDSGAAIGAILGGIVAADQNRVTYYKVITGYRNEQKCNIVNEYKTITTRDGSFVTYNWNGLVGQIHTYNNYNVGDKISVNVLIN